MALSELENTAQTLKQAIKAATQGLIDRELLADLIILAAVAGEHLLVIGPPGTAKSAVVQRVANALGGRYFEYLLGRFTEPSEIFGPVDLRKLRDGIVATETSGMLPEAEVVFLDEVFLGSTAILNTLLGILNERIFRRGHTEIRCPLRVCVGAANTIPQDSALAAFADRFLLRVFLAPVADAQLEALLDGGWQAGRAENRVTASLQQLDQLSSAVRRMEPAVVQTALAHCVRRLRQAGIDLSDRRIVKAQTLVCAAAALAGRPQPDNSDLWPLVYVIRSQEGQLQGREVLHDLLQQSDNRTLNAAVEDASASPQARAERIMQQAQILLTEKPGQETELEHWRLRIEALGREIDAGFSEQALSDELKNVRGQLAAELPLNE